MTHMEAYKFGYAYGLLEREIEAGQDKALKRQVGIGTVSYTHLDVYKRQVSNYVGNYAYYLDVYEIQTDVTNNRSIVRVDVWLTSGTRSWDSISAVGGTVTINGGQQNFSKVVSIGAGGKVVLATCDAWVYHNATGGGSIGISSTFSPTSSYSPGYCQASGTYTLSTIPRASTPSMGAFKAGDNVTAVSYTHLDVYKRQSLGCHL